MLMDNAQTGCEGIGVRSPSNGTSPEDDLASVCGQEARRNVEERGLPCSILAQEDVQRASMNGQRRCVERHGALESLDDPPEFEGVVLTGHRPVGASIV